MPAPRITLSIVSHRQNALVNGLLGDLAAHCAEDIPIVLTENVPDGVAFAAGGLAGRMQIIRNTRPRGFGANHNAAFVLCRTPYFCVCNPDIHLASDPFPALLQAIAAPRVAAAGPLVRSPKGWIEDSARRFPTIGSLLRKSLGGRARAEYPVDEGALEVDWVGGMFMLLRSQAFRLINGFDERYFLYYEDVDLCRRLRNAGKSVVYCPSSEVVHDARRASRKEPRMARHHLASAIRYFLRS